jgi:hypothetical protein
VTEADPDALIDRTENWFVRQGIPHFIDDFTASEDVWTRAAGVLSFIFFCELFLTFGGEIEGVAQFGVFLVGLGVLVGAIGLVNRWRGRRWFARPDTIGAGELALFVLVPPVLALLGGHRDNGGFILVVIANLVFLLVLYVVVSWGLFAMARWGLEVMTHHLRAVLQLLGRTLPLMLLFSAFLFLNAEIWQVANNFSLPLFAVVIGALVVIGLSFLLGSLSGAIDELRTFDAWEEIGRELGDTPLAGFDVSCFEEDPRRVPLSSAARRNLSLRLLVGLGAQVLLVAMLIFVFYTGFGLLTVREDTLLQWTTRTFENEAEIILLRFRIFGDEILLTTLHLIVSGFVAAFSGLQFAVSLVTDSAYRKEFVEESNAEVREALAVRAVYLRLSRQQAELA